MWQGLKSFFLNTVKGINAFLIAHPAVKNLLNGLANAALGGAVAYLGPQISTLLHGGAITAGSLTIGGLYFAVSKSVAAWIQFNHDLIMADIQNGLNLVQSGQPSANGSVPVTPLLQVKSPLVLAKEKLIDRGTFEIKGGAILRKDNPQQ